jgi:hypothetical protein
MELPFRLLRLKIDPSVITGPYQLLTVFLAFTQVLLAYWLFYAQSEYERVFIGLVMLTLLGGLLFVVIRLQQPTATPINLPTGHSTVEEISATVEKTSDRSPNTMAGPDRSYLINSVPDGWQSRELTAIDFSAEALGIQDPAAKQKLFSTANPAVQTPDILVFEYKKQISITPIPGRTMMDGRKIPTALETVAPIQLAIIPIERAQPPWFVERSMEHNFLLTAGQILSLGALTARRASSGLIPDSDRRFMILELQQELKDCIVDGKEGHDVIVDVQVISIEGELRDHILIAKYVTVSGVPELEHAVQTLQTLVASFRPAKLNNLKEKRKENAVRAEENFKKILAEHGEKVFYAELHILAFRLQGIDLDDPKARLRAMNSLKPFPLFAREINLHTKELDAFWEAMHLAETGDATKFKAELSELIQSAVSEQEKQADKTVLPATANAKRADPSTPSGQAAPS